MNPGSAQIQLLGSIQTVRDLIIRDLRHLSQSTQGLLRCLDDVNTMSSQLSGWEVPKEVSKRSNDDHSCQDEYQQARSDQLRCDSKEPGEAMDKEIDIPEDEDEDEDEGNRKQPVYRVQE